MNGISFLNYGFTWDEAFLSKFNLDKENKDDNFLGSILKFIADNPTEQILVLSDDYGVQMKSVLHKIPFLASPDKYLVLDDDKENQEIKKLSVELNLLKNRQPKLDFLFSNGKEFFSTSIDRPRPIVQHEIDLKMNSIKTEYPILVMDNEEKEEENSLKILRRGFNLFPKTPEKIEKYNAALESFYSEYEDFLKQEKIRFYKDQLTISIHLELSNIGTLPADDVDIYMHFPDGFILSENRPSEKLKKPELPDLAEFQMAMPKVSRLFNPIAFDYMKGKLKPDSGNFSIKKTNSYDVRQHLISLKHNEQISIRTLYCTFNNYEEAKNFSIDFNITSGNIVQKITGTLHVVINKKG